MTTKDTAHNTRIIYKGDVLSGAFYLLLGALISICTLLCYFFTDSLGYYYLSIALAILSIYCTGKGFIMIIMYGSRKRYYANHLGLDVQEIKEERRYTRYRVLKKKKNRRIHIYLMTISSIIAFLGLFHQEKGLIVSCCVPIIIISAVEFSIGLLTEFRLTEYLKHLHKLTFTN